MFCTPPAGPSSKQNNFRLFSFLFHARIQRKSKVRVLLIHIRSQTHLNQTLKMLRRHGSGSQTDCTRGYLSHNRMHHFTFFACFPLSVFAFKTGRQNAAEDRIVKNILHFFFYWQTTSSLPRGRFWEFVFHTFPK